MKSWFLRKINSISNHLTKFNKKIGKKTKINEIRSMKMNITTYTSEIQKIIVSYFQHLF